MNLADILIHYPHFDLASKSDNDQILDFFKTAPMVTKDFSVRYDRGDDFFAFTEEQSERAIIFVIRDEKKRIKGTASIIVVEHYFNGKQETCAYLGDLRISPLLNAKIRISWKKCYGDIIENFSKIEEFKGIRYLYSAILDSNQDAMRSLLKNNERIIYHELKTYETISVYRKKFLTKIKSNGPRLCRPTIQELDSFFEETTYGPGMNFPLHPKNLELERRKETWKGLNYDDFLVVKNTDGKIIASVLPWMCQTKKLVIEDMGKMNSILGHLFPLIGIPALKKKKAVHVLNLTHLIFDKSITKPERVNAINIILDHLLKKPLRNFHLISFFSYPEWQMTSELPFYFEKTKAKFYQVMNREQYESRDFLNLENHPPAFEIGTA